MSVDLPSTSVISPELHIISTCISLQKSTASVFGASALGGAFLFSLYGRQCEHPKLLPVQFLVTGHIKLLEDILNGVASKPEKKTLHRDSAHGDGNEESTNF